MTQPTYSLGSEPPTTHLKNGKGRNTHCRQRLQTIGNTGLLSNSLSIKVFKFFYAFDIAIKQINIDLSIDNISEGNELMILLFKYPKSNDSMTLERSLEYSVMGLRFNLTNNSTYPQSIKFLNDNDTNDYNARISMVNVQSSNEAILELEKRSNDSVELLLGQTSNENSRHSILPFINGSLIEKNELPPNTVYEISDNKLYRIPIKIPVTKKENSIFQLVDVLSPYQMDDGIYSITEIDFSNPVLIKNSK